MNNVIIDVRERDEYETEHVEHSINVPLSSFSAVAPGVLNMCQSKNVTFMCLSGARATQAKEQAKGLGFTDISFDVYEGGINQWKRDGNSVISAGKTPLTLIRQVQMFIGTMIITFGVLGYFYHPVFAAITAFMGAGMFYAGVSGECALANVIAKMPWNRSSKLECSPCNAAS